MIKYTLVCDKIHTFEGWFRNSDDFDAQCERGLVVCPICGSKHIKKGLMAPAVSTARKKSERAEKETAIAASGGMAATAATPEPAAPAPATAKSLSTALLPNDVRQKELVEALRMVRAQVIETSEHVGSNFAAEARKIHYGDAEERNIYGETTATEAKDLLEEGITVLPIPELPDEKN